MNHSKKDFSKVTPKEAKRNFNKGGEKMKIYAGGFHNARSKALQHKKGVERDYERESEINK